MNTLLIAAVALGATALGTEPLVEARDDAVVVRLDRANLALAEDRARLLAGVEAASLTMCRNAQLFDPLENRALCRLRIAREIAAALGPDSRAALRLAKAERPAG